LTWFPGVSDSSGGRKASPAHSKCSLSATASWRLPTRVTSTGECYPRCRAPLLRSGQWQEFICAGKCTEVTPIKWRWSAKRVRGCGGESSFFQQAASNSPTPRALPECQWPIACVLLMRLANRVIQILFGLNLEPSAYSDDGNG